MTEPVKEAVQSRLVVITHLWPSISPWNVWDLTWGDWLMYARAADAWTTQKED